MSKELPVVRMAYYNLTQLPDGRVVDIDEKPFSANQYSRFKHGDTRVQRLYGCALADTFADLFMRSDAIIAPFAFMYVPTAEGNMTRFMHERIGQYRMEWGLPGIDRFHVHKSVAHGNHRADHAYAAVSLAERRAILQRAPLSTDFSRLEGRTVILVDDIRITGSSEAVLLDLMRGSGAKELAFLYVANMDARIAAENPGIESFLNQYRVKSLAEMGEILLPGHYAFNLRNCKFILEHDSVEVRTFAEFLANSVLEDLWRTILDNSYYLEPTYQGAIQAIRGVMLDRKLLGSVPDVALNSHRVIEVVEEVRMQRVA